MCRRVVTIFLSCLSRPLLSLSPPPTLTTTLFLPPTPPSPHPRLEWTDGLFAVAWSETHDKQLLTGAGDGSLQLWDVGLAPRVAGPIRVWREHGKEVSAVAWSASEGETRAASASWDGTVKLWDPQRRPSLCTLAAHSGNVYAVGWATGQRDVVYSAGGDGCLRVWDLRRAAEGAAQVGGCRESCVGGREVPSIC